MTDHKNLIFLFKIRWYFIFKSVSEWFFAFIMLFLLLPILAVVALAIRLDSAGAALFLQQRVGYRGKIITLYKFRTMYIGNNSVKEDNITHSHDKRITRLGHYLRNHRIDELPQIINILRGEMSWIGPRPEATLLSVWYEQEIPFYCDRHMVKPGITGWAQINQGHVTSLKDVTIKLQLDLYYIKNFSLWLDIFIALKTIRIILTGKGAK